MLLYVSRENMSHVDFLANFRWSCHPSSILLLNSLQPRLSSQTTAYCTRFHENTISESRRLNEVLRIGDYHSMVDDMIHQYGSSEDFDKIEEITNDAQ
jgi:hypothetical protein